MTEQQPENGALLSRVGFWLFHGQFLWSIASCKPGNFSSVTLLFLNVARASRLILSDNDENQDEHTENAMAVGELKGLILSIYDLV